MVHFQNRVHSHRNYVYSHSMLLTSIIVSNLAFDLRRIIKFARDTQNSSDANERQRMIRTVGNLIEDGLAPLRGRKGSRTYLKSSELPALYLLNKIFYCFNALFQIGLANWLLGVHDVFFGWSLLTRLSEGTNWDNSGIFPRVTMCDFEVRTGISHK
jgi:hypothetical protein